MIRRGRGQESIGQRVRVPTCSPRNMHCVDATHLSNPNGNRASQYIILDQLAPDLGWSTIELIAEASNSDTIWRQIEQNLRSNSTNSRKVPFLAIHQTESPNILTYDFVVLQDLILLGSAENLADSPVFGPFSPLIRSQFFREVDLIRWSSATSLKPPWRYLAKC
jgi:hypothetical protein